MYTAQAYCIQITELRINEQIGPGHSCVVDMEIFYDAIMLLVQNGGSKTKYSQLNATKIRNNYRIRRLPYFFQIYKLITNIFVSIQNNLPPFH